MKRSCSHIPSSNKEERGQQMMTIDKGGGITGKYHVFMMMRKKRGRFYHSKSLKKVLREGLKKVLKKVLNILSTFLSTQKNVKKSTFVEYCSKKCTEKY